LANFSSCTHAVSATLASTPVPPQKIRAKAIAISIPALLDRSAQEVAVGQIPPRERRAHGHDILLVQEDAVALPQDGLETGVEVFDRLLAVGAPDEGVLHARPRGPGTHEGEGVDGAHQVLHLQLGEELPHGGRLDLKTAQGPPRLEQPRGPPVLLGEGLQVDPFVPVLLHEPHGLTQGGEGAVPQEVELDQADPLGGAHLQLGDHDPLGGPLQRHVPIERLVGDHDAAGVDAEVPWKTLEGLGFLHGGAVGLLVEGDEAGHVPVEADRLGQIHVGTVGDALGEAVHRGGGDPVGLGGLAEGGARPQGAVGGDEGGAVPAVGAVDVVDDLVAPPPAQVHVEVRQVGAPFVEEPLEVEAVAQGVHVRDAEEVGHDGTRPRPAADHGDGAGAGEADDLPHHDEVLGEAQLLQERQLTLHARRRLLRGDRSIAKGEPFPGETPQVGRRRLAGGKRRSGEDGPSTGGLSLASFRGAEGVRQRLGDVGEALGHGFRSGEIGLAVEGVARLELGEEAVLPDGAEGAVEGEALRHGEGGVGAGHEPQAEPPGYPGQGALEGEAPARPDEFEPETLAGNGPPDRLRQPGRFGEHGEPLPEFAKGGSEAKRRFPFLLGEFAAGEDAAEVLVARGVADEEDGRVPFGLGDAGAHDGPDARLSGRVEERDETVEVVVVGQGQGGKTKGLRPGHHLRDRRRAAEQREVASYVQGDVGRRFHDGLHFVKHGVRST
jgi:hypothetical protein